MTSDEVARCWEANAEAWTSLSRAGYDVYRDALNTPAFLAMLPPIAGLRGLDVGCGEGSNTRKLASAGASMTGIDIAPTFVRHAEEEERRQPLGIGYQVGDGAALPFPAATFDFLTAFMSLMDMADAGGALREAARVLKPGGFAQVSLLHPCFVPPYRKVIREGGAARAIAVGGYFQTEEWIDTWIFSTVPPELRQRTPPFRVPRFHRTLAEWVDLVLQAGLRIEKLGEPRPTPEEAAREPILDDALIAPLFLHIRAVKPAAG